MWYLPISSMFIFYAATNRIPFYLPPNMCNFFYLFIYLPLIPIGGFKSDWTKNDPSSYGPQVGYSLAHRPVSPQTLSTSLVSTNPREADSALKPHCSSQKPQACTVEIMENMKHSGCSVRHACMFEKTTLQPESKRTKSVCVIIGSTGATVCIGPHASNRQWDGNMAHTESADYKTTTFVLHKCLDWLYGCTIYQNG